MEFNKKAIVIGTVFFFLGGACVYLMINSKNEPARKTVAAQSAMKAAIAEMQQHQTNAEPQQEAVTPAPDNSVEEATHESFLAAAEERRQQQISNKMETERLEKLRKEKLNTVECKFWKQQKATSSTAAKINSSIEEHCLLPEDHSSNSSSESSIGQ